MNPEHPAILPYNIKLKYTVNIKNYNLIALPKDSEEFFSWKSGNNMFKTGVLKQTRIMPVMQSLVNCGIEFVAFVLYV